MEAFILYWQCTIRAYLREGKMLCKICILGCTCETSGDFGKIGLYSLDACTPASVRTSRIDRKFRTQRKSLQVTYVVSNSAYCCVQMARFLPWKHFVPFLHYYKEQRPNPFRLINGNLELSGNVFTCFTARRKTFLRCLFSPLGIQYSGF